MTTHVLSIQPLARQKIRLTHSFLTSFNPWSSRWLITGYWSVSHLNSLGMPILSPPAPPLSRARENLPRPPP